MSQDVYHSRQKDLRQENATPPVHGKSVAGFTSFATNPAATDSTMVDDGNTAEPWTLTLADRALVMTKYGVNHLRFAVLLLFYRTHGRFPSKPTEIDDAAVAYVAR